MKLSEEQAATELLRRAEEQGPALRELRRVLQEKVTPVAFTRPDKVAVPTPNLYHVRPGQPAHGPQIIIGRVITRIMSHEEACNLAAWLVACATPTLNEAQRIARIADLLAGIEPQVAR